MAEFSLIPSPADAAVFTLLPSRPQRALQLGQRAGGVAVAAGSRVGAAGRADNGLDAPAPAVVVAASPELTAARARAAALDATLRHATPQAILAAALAEFPGSLALVSSFGAESAVLLHMAAQLDPTIPVVFLDTGQLFAQTVDYRRSLSQRLGLTNVQDVRPAHADLVLADPGGDLWKRDTDACCGVRKVQPLAQSLAPYAAWITGRKRFQGGDRLSLPAVEADVDGKLKFNPLVNLTKAEIADYAAEHDLPAHPLVAAGFPSIGCWPCTNPVEEGQDERAGRWSGSGKTECGIHVTRLAGSDPDLGGGI